MMFDEFYRLCSTRKSCRHFSSEPIPDDIIDNIIKVASTSPYASGRCNWNILVVKERCRIEQLENIVKKAVREIVATIHDRDMAEMFEKYAKNFTLFSNAPVVIIPVFRVAPTFGAMLRENMTEQLKEWERDNCVKSIACVTSWILLAAHSLELGACCMTGPLVAVEQLKQELGIVGNDRTIGALIPIGYRE